MQPLPKVLLVEDDRGIATALTHALRTTYQVTTTASGRRALQRANLQPYDLIILDLTLPDLPGLLVCQELREHGIEAPILILTGEGRVLTKINLLDAGANDYLTKPFSLGELKARLRALARSGAAALPAPTQLVVGDLLLNRHTNQVSRQGVTIRLRRKEFALLECLMERAGDVVSREALMRYVWQGNADLWTNTVDVHIKYLRDKLDRPFAQQQPLIQTVHGLGYRIAVQLPAVERRSCGHVD